MAGDKVMTAPRSVDIALTGKCNLTCQYCFYADEMVARSNLPTERWLTFFDELGRVGVMDVTLTGGEVFTRPDLWTLIDGVIANRMRYSLLTNGTLITEKTLAEFAQGKRRARLNSIQVSIDGSSAEIHDQSRPRSFNRALRGLKLLLDAGFPMTVRVTINRHNVDDLENIAYLLLEEIGLPGFSTNEAFVCGATNRAEDEVVLTSQQRQESMAALLDLSKRYQGRIRASAGPLAVAQQFERIKESLAKGITSFPGHGTLGSCGGVFNRLAVLHDGTIVPCHIISTLHLGVIGVDDVQEVWLEHPIMKQLRQRSFIPLDSLDTCHGCDFIGFCNGGCPAGALAFTGDINTRNPMNCFRVYKGQEPFCVDESVLKGCR